MNFLTITIYVLLDQLTKIMAIKRLKESGSYVLIKDYLNFTYVENRGAAFGILQNGRVFFVIFTVFIIISIFIINSRCNFSKLASISFGAIVGGGIGNLIDRLRLGYVIDFVDIKFGDFYDFPVFNFADVFLVVGTVLLMILLAVDRFEEVLEDE